MQNTHNETKNDQNAIFSITHQVLYRERGMPAYDALKINTGSEETINNINICLKRI